MILNRDVAGQANRVGEDDVIAQLAVVSDVRVAEEESVGADAGGGLRNGAAVHGGVFTEHIVVADLEVGRLAGILQVLGLAADAREGKELIALAEGGRAFEHHIGVEHAVITQNHIRAHHAEGADLHVVADLGVW